MSNKSVYRTFRDLSDAQLRRINYLLIEGELPMPKIARLFGVSRETIFNIKHGKIPKKDKTQ